MKLLVIVVHPNIQKSRVNRAWKEVLETEAEITVHELYKEYPNENINVHQEQKLLEDHERIIFQFPMQWYSSPSLLKKWLDQVLLQDWAYGPEGNALRNKEFGIAVSFLLKTITLMRG